MHVRQDQFIAGNKKKVIYNVFITVYWMHDFLHIVCLDAPAPPDYGGAIDMFYKVKALHGIGEKLILHYFDYRPSRNADALKPYCVAIHAYQRKSFIRSAPLTSPFIVHSRINSDLIDRLNEDNYPILLEGLHCAGILPFLRNKKRAVVRMHNEEASYYHHLAKTENSLWRRAYFLQESRLLKKYQQAMNKTIPLACLSESDMVAFKNEYGFEQQSFIPCFLPWQELKNAEGKGSFCLYHGNLSVPENEKAALWLIQNVFRKTDIPFLISGKGISKKLTAKGRLYSNITFIPNPTIAEIDQLVQEAHINVLPSLNNTGVKLKLLNALFNGRFCITNMDGVKGSRIQQGVTVEDQVENWIATINSLMSATFSAKEIEERKAVLLLYNNRLNAEKLSALWRHYR